MRQGIPRSTYTEPRIQRSGAITAFVLSLSSAVVGSFERIIQVVRRQLTAQSRGL